MLDLIPTAGYLEGLPGSTVLWRYHVTNHDLTYSVDLV